MSDYILKSPNQNLILTLNADDGALTYSVVKNGVTVIDCSPIGAVLDGADLTSGLTVTGAEEGKIDESYHLPAYKKAVCEDRCNTLTLQLAKDGYPLTVEARAYDEAAAFRMIFSETDILRKEEVGFAVPEDARAVWAMKFRFTYEDEFTRVPLEDLHQNLWIFPLLIEEPKGVWALLTEAAVYGDYGGHILSSMRDNKNMLNLTPPPDDFGEQKVPVKTPWRVILAGSLDEIVNSSVIENLNPPETQAYFRDGMDDSFIKGGIASWSWMTETESPGNFLRQKDFIDLAAKMGWPYCLVDGGWQRHHVNIPALVEYGKKKGVGIWVWEHQHTFKDRRWTNEFFHRLNVWGVVGVKIDFFESDTRERIAKYDMLAQAAADYHLMLNFHGASKPTGIMRQYPHVLSYEGVMGGENFQNYATEYFVQTTARHNCTLPFTRNAVGPMDYTPSTFGTYRTGTTDCHQAALPVIFVSYITHIAESPEVLEGHPCAEFLKGLPAAWDESHLLEGQPGCYVTFARRKETTWYVAGICAVRSRTSTVKLDFLDDGEYKATLYQDGMDDLHAVDVPRGAMPPIEKEQYDKWEELVSRPTSHMHDLRLADISTFTVTKGQTLEIPCLQDGGFALKLEKV